jgi:hypothetical protein
MQHSLDGSRRGVLGSRFEKGVWPSSGWWAIAEGRRAARRWKGTISVLERLVILYACRCKLLGREVRVRHLEALLRCRKRTSRVISTPGRHKDEMNKRGMTHLRRVEDLLDLEQRHLFRLERGGVRELLLDDHLDVPQLKGDAQRQQTVRQPGAHVLRASPLQSRSRAPSRAQQRARAPR